MPSCRPGAATALLVVGLIIVILPGTVASSPNVPAATSEETEGAATVRELLGRGSFEEAEAHARRLFEKAVAAQGPEAEKTMAILGLLLESLKGSGKTSSEDSRALADRLARYLYTRAAGLQGEGDYIGARALFDRNLEVAESFFGAEDYRVAWVLNAMAVIDDLTGDYASARRLYERALGIARVALKPDNPFIASCLNNLGLVYRSLGDLDKAREETRLALNLSIETRGKEHPYTASTMKNLGDLLQLMNELEAAEELYQKALAIRKRDPGPDSAEVAATQLALADLHAKLGEVEEAERLYRSCMAIWDVVFPEGHPDVAYGLMGLAGILVERRDYASSTEYLERAREIRERFLGPEHPLVAKVLVALSTVHERMGHLQRAFELAMQAEATSRKHTRLIVSSLPERSALAYTATTASGRDLILSLAARGEASSRRVDALDTLIRSRALILDEMARRRQALLGEDSPEVLDLRRALAQASRTLATMIVRGPTDADPQGYRTDLNEAQANKERIERLLAEKSTSFRKQRKRREVGLESIFDHLPPESALVSIAQFQQDGAQIDRGPSRRSVEGRNGPRYSAFILRHGARVPDVVILGRAAEIDELVSDWLRGVADGALASVRSSAATETRFREVGEKLRKRIWDPLVAHLGDSERVFVVPDGDLNLVNFYALPVDRKNYLVDDGPLIHYLSTERDLLPPPSGEAPGSGLLALGGPAFDEVAALASSTREPMESGSEELRSGCAGIASLSFPDLPAAREEAVKIVELWRRATADGTNPVEAEDATHLQGSDASENAFKEAAPGKRHLHLATHGFFLDEECRASISSSRGIGGLAPTTTKEPALRPRGSPFLLSGLVLAGANHRRAATPAMEDGILTAREISAMDLQGVHWAVLSACKTGRGRVKAGEGVFGLRRAFQIAGARTVIMSLWSVEDESALEWMTALYEGYLLRHLETVEAVREATRHVLRNRRSAGLATHPFYWAAFVAVGDWS